MKSKNIKVIDEHNIDRDANVMFAFELDGSEYVVYWISRDEESNNVFVSKVLKNLDGTNSLLNIDDDDKKKEIADIVKALISSSVSDQNDKLVGVTTSLSNGKVAKFVNVSFNKEQQINVTKTYITTVKKEVTKVAETYYDVVTEEASVDAVLMAAPIVEPVADIFPSLDTAPVAQPTVIPQPIITPIAPVVEPTPVQVEPVVAAPVAPVIEPAAAVVAQPAVVPAVPVVEPTPVQVEPVVASPVVPAADPTAVVIPQPAVVPAVPVVESTPVQVEPVVAAPAVPAADPATVVIPQPAVVPAVPVVESTLVQVEPVVAAPVASAVEPAVAQPLVFNASKETNLNAALGEVANSTIPVVNIDSVREFGVETAQVSSTVVPPMTQPEVPEMPKTLTKKAGFANSKFFMVVAIAFFMASCIFLGYEVFNYFQLVK